MPDRFTLLSELGRGGMGVVWKARDEETGQIVALKLLRETYAEDPDYLARFERELELAKRIHSRNVVAVFGYGVRDKTPYLALEHIDGQSLRERLTTHGPYTWTEARPLLAQIAQGLADAHAAGVIHRDLKPSNVLIGSDGVAKLADFGIAKGLDLTRMTGTSTLLGTPAYLPPEGPNDERSDLYSLGCIAYEMLTGVVPFEGRTYQEVILRHVRETPNLEKLPVEARPVVGWLLAKDAADRPQRAGDLLPVLWGGAEVPAKAAQSARMAPTPPKPVDSSKPPVRTIRVSTAKTATSQTRFWNARRTRSGNARRFTNPTSRRRQLAVTMLPAIILAFVAGGFVIAFFGSSLAGFVAPTPSETVKVSPTVTVAPSTPSPTSTLVPTPVPTQAFIIYTVGKGDTAAGIAATYGITFQMLKDANPQLPNLPNLRVGDLLNIPVLPSPAPTTVPPGSHKP